MMTCGVGSFPPRLSWLVRAECAHVYIYASHSVYT
jgi:hypothetical protein